MEIVNTKTEKFEESDIISIHSNQESIFASTDLEETYQRMIAKILESFATYLKKGSGWRLRRVIRLDITVSKLNPLKGSSYLPLPKCLKTRSL